MVHYIKWGYDEENGSDETGAEKKSEKKEGEEEDVSTSKVKLR